MKGILGKCALAAIPVLLLSLPCSSVALNKFDILVNDDNSSTDQLSPRAATDRFGNFFIIWADKRNGQNDIYGQYFDTSGTPLGSNIRANDEDSTNNPQFEPAIAGNSSGMFVSVWRDYRNGDYPFKPDIYFAKIDSTASNPNVNVTSEPPDSTKESPDIALFPDGSSIAVWSDYRNHNWDIYGQKLNSNGALIGRNFKVNNEAGGYQQHSPRVATFDDGGFVVVWYDNRNGNDDIFGQIYNSFGNSVGTNFKLNDDASNSRQAFPSVAADGSKRISVAWVDWKNGVYPQNPDIYFRRFDSTGNPLISSMKINLDGGNNPQREVSICSDWLGNIALVWSDSSSGQWDAMAQLIDHAGTRIGTNFRVHQSQTGRQLQPDVEADGYKLFFVWADSRTGNFDIYATIYEYNQPELMSTPATLDFSMEQGGALPLSQSVILSNAGIGSLPWSASTSAGWLSVAPSTGSTPDTLTVSITDASLQYGDYYAYIRLTNLETQDSSSVIQVKLQVTAPVLDVEPDTIYFKVFAAMGNPSPKTIQINNIGSGLLTWNAVENADWYSTDKLSGSESEYIVVSVDIAGLNYGHQWGPIIIASPEAMNSPETAVVHLELVGNIPYLAANPDSIVIEGKKGDSLSGSFQILNMGQGATRWTASPADNWISIQSSSGTDNDMVNFSLETSSLEIGNHLSHIIITDTASFNQSLSILIDLRLLPSDTVEPTFQPDTLLFGSDTVAIGSISSIPLSIVLTGPRKGGYIPVAVDGGANLDSARPVYSDIPSYVELFATSGGKGIGEIGFRIADSYLQDSLIPAGKYLICDLYVTAGLAPAACEIDTTHSDSSSAYILTESFEKSVPALSMGTIIVQSPPLPDPDTVQFLGGNAPTNGIGVVPMSIKLVRPAKGVYIPFSFDTSYARLDSIILDKEALPSGVDYDTSIKGDGKAEFGFIISAAYFNDSIIPAGNYGIAQLFFITGPRSGIVSVDTSTIDTASVYILRAPTAKETPCVRSGALTINGTTGISEPNSHNVLPREISLGQNLPNPFNSETEFEISLPRSMPVTMTLYNVLGQEVNCLYNGNLPAGITRLRWDGILANNKPAPGGIYFYRLRAGEEVLVKKMVLLK